MREVLSALRLALGQLAEPAMLRVLAKSALVTIILVGLLGWGGWYLLEGLLAWAGLSDGRFAGAGTTRDVLAVLLTLIAGWLLWRLVAMAVIEFFADEVILAVEAKHYPAAAERARDLSIPEQFAASLGTTAKALLVNLAVLPVALVLLVTGIGPALLFWLVNAALIGRQLDAAVWQRHRHAAGARSPASGAPRFLLGSAISGLLAVPFVNLLAPLLGAAAATHLAHRIEARRNG